MTRYHLYVNNPYTAEDRRIVSTDDPKEIQKEADYYGFKNLRLFTGEIDLNDFAAEHSEIFFPPRMGRL